MEILWKKNQWNKEVTSNPDHQKKGENNTRQTEGEQITETQNNFKAIGEYL